MAGGRSANRLHRRCERDEDLHRASKKVISGLKLSVPELRELRSACLNQASDYNSENARQQRGAITRLPAPAG